MQRVAVIGLGNIARRHRCNLKALFPDAVLYALSASGRIPNDPVSDCDHLLTNINELVVADVQLAIVASPAPFHAQHALPLIKAGVPVLIEKPVATKLEDIDRLISVAGSYGTPVAVGYCLRYLPSAQKVHQLLTEQKVGQLYNASIEVGQYLPDWRPDKDFRESVSAKSELGGGVLLELSHELDYSRWLLGELNIETAILRSSETLGLEVEDSADLMAKTDKGAVVYLHLDFLQRSASRRCRFIGSEGTLEWDLIENTVMYNAQGERELLYSDPGLDRNEMYLEMIRDFVRKTQGKNHVSVSLQDARGTLALIHKIKRQAYMGSHT